ncbi:putative pit accessory protein [Candidatus Terasakiella magnetica]|nr:putative pit accessory protein [Candidatus Terasakiella magnetica]
MFFRLFRALMPKEERFVELFAQHAVKVHAAAMALEDMMADGADIQVHFKRICTFEGEADSVTRQTLQALHRSFITPFDRDQIHKLITTMDDAVDGIEEVAQRVDLYSVTEFTPDMRALATGITECARLLIEAIPLLNEVSKNADQINQLCDAIGQQESVADKCQHEGLRRLFATERDPVKLITRKEIYQRLEKVSDRFDDVANVIETIVIEQV